MADTANTNNYGVDNIRVMSDMSRSIRVVRVSLN